MEQKINITEKQGKNGKTYKNINLKDLDVGNYCIVEKQYAEGLKVQGKFGDVFSVGLKYCDESVSAWLNAKDNEVFKNLGGVGDRLKVTAEEMRATNPKTKVTMLYKKLKFELE
jgi:hypothetical protein